jgi:hypothetical protein
MRIAGFGERSGAQRRCGYVNDKQREAAGDRRQSERRKGGSVPPEEERRKTDRRAPGKEAGADA